MFDASRREFLAASALALSSSRVLGANDRINIVLVGCGGRGHGHIGELSRNSKEARIVGVCDVHRDSRERAQAYVASITGQQVPAYEDMRKAFEQKDVDAVIVATPNHWHALATMWACQAGKDVYVEKPVTHNVAEGAQMIEVARRTHRIVQAGSQGRSIPHKIKAIQLVHDGVIGEVYLSRGLCYKLRPSIGHRDDSPVPAGLNWDMFLGPAPNRPFNALRFKYNYHWFWDTGDSDIGAQGIHELDLCRWAMGDVGWPKTVSATGGKFIWKDDQETPNTQAATFDYGNFQIMFEVRNLATGHEGGLPIPDKTVYKAGRIPPDPYVPLGPAQPPPADNTIGNLFYGSKGWMALDNNGFRVYKGNNNECIMDEQATRDTFHPPTGPDTTPHLRNFFAAIRSRNPKDLNAEIAVGVMSTNLCHLANVSYRVRRTLTIEAPGRIANDEQANALMGPFYRNPYDISAYSV